MRVPSRWSRPGAQVWSAPARRTSSSCPRCLATARIVASGWRSRSAAVVSTPIVPAPITATVESGPSCVRRARVDAAGERLDHHRVLVVQVVGHLVELRAVRHEALAPAAAGLAAEADLQSRADRALGRPPTQSACRPSSHSGQGGSLPRARQPSAGSTTTRLPRSSPAVTSATISCPGTNGDEVSDDRYSEAWPSIIAWSEPQMPDRRGRSGTQSRSGRRGGSISVEVERAGADARHRPRGDVARERRAVLQREHC